MVRVIENNLVMFQFFLGVDKEKVLADGPWSFDGCPLLLKEIKEQNQWPFNDELLGTFMEYDESDHLGWNKYMRFRSISSLIDRCGEGYQ
ncbi:Protein FAM98A [Bienertia sinuspersici]